MKTFAYAKFIELNNGETTLTFNEIGTDVEVKILKKGFAVLIADTKKAIDTLISKQEADINTVIINKEEFVEAVKDCAAVLAINEAVSLSIRNKYTIADELGMAHRDDEDPKKIEFLAYREEQRQIGREQKAELGL